MFSCFMITQIAHKVATRQKQDSHATVGKCTRAAHVEVDLKLMKLISRVAAVRRSVDKRGLR